MLALLCAVAGLAQPGSPDVLQTSVAVDWQGALQATSPTQSSSTIPRQIFLTAETSNLSEEEASYLAQWRKLNPGYSVELFNATAREEMMRTSFPDKPDVYRVFRSLPLGVMKADLWRYAVLFLRGGIYVDTDMKALQPMEKMLEGTGSSCRNVLLVANSGGGHFAQGFLAAEPGTELLAHVIDKVVQRVVDDGGVDFRKHGGAAGQSTKPGAPYDYEGPGPAQPGSINCGPICLTVLHYTGPPMWTDAVAEVAGLQQLRFHEHTRHDAYSMLKSPKFAKAGFCVPDAIDPTNKANLIDNGLWVKHMHMGMKKGHWFHTLPARTALVTGNGSTSADDGFFPLYASDKLEDSLAEGAPAPSSHFRG